MMNAKRNISVILMAALIVGLAASATATIIPRIEFEPIGPVTVGAEDIELFALIMEGDPGQVIFEFYNENLVSSSVIRINFEDNGLDRVDDIQSAEGVSFEKDINFVNSPNSDLLYLDFDPTFSIRATSSPPPIWSGIRPDEQLTVTVDLDYGTSYSDIVSDLGNGSVRIGMHVIVPSSSSSFYALSEIMVNEVPEPATIVLFGFGSMILIKRSKYRKNRN